MLLRRTYFSEIMGVLLVVGMLLYTVRQYYIQPVKIDPKLLWPYDEYIGLNDGDNSDLHCVSASINANTTEYGHQWKRNGLLIAYTDRPEKLTWKFHKADYRDAGCYQCSIFRANMDDIIESRTVCVTVRRAMTTLEETQNFPVLKSYIEIECKHQGHGYQNFYWMRKDMAKRYGKSLRIYREDLGKDYVKWKCVFEDIHNFYSKSFTFLNGSENDFAIDYLTHEADNTMSLYWSQPIQDINGDMFGRNFVKISINDHLIDRVAAERKNFNFQPPDNVDFNLTIQLFSYDNRILRTIVLSCRSNNDVQATVNVMEKHSTSVQLMMNVTNKVQHDSLTRYVVIYHQWMALGLFKFVPTAAAYPQILANGSLIVNLSKLIPDTIYCFVVKINAENVTSNISIDPKATRYFIKTLPATYPKPMYLKPKSVSSNGCVLEWKSIMPLKDEKNLIYVLFCHDIKSSPSTESTTPTTSTASTASKRQCNNVTHVIDVKKGVAERQFKIYNLFPDQTYFISLRESNYKFKNPSLESLETMIKTEKSFPDTEIANKLDVEFIGCKINVSWKKIAEELRKNFLNTSFVGYLIEIEFWNKKSDLKYFFDLEKTEAIVQLFSNLCQFWNYELRFSVENNNGPVWSTHYSYSNRKGLVTFFSLLFLVIFAIAFIIKHYDEENYRMEFYDEVRNSFHIDMDKALRVVCEETHATVGPREYLEKFCGYMEDGEKGLKDAYVKLEKLKGKYSEKFCFRELTDRSLPLSPIVIEPRGNDDPMTSKYYIVPTQKSDNMNDLWRLVEETQASNLVVLTCPHPSDPLPDKSPDDMFPEGDRLIKLPNMEQFSSEKKVTSCPDQDLIENIGGISHKIYFTEIFKRNDQCFTIHLMKHCPWDDKPTPQVFANFMINYIKAYKEYWGKNVVVMCQAYSEMADIFVALCYITLNFRNLEWKFSIDGALLFLKDQIRSSFADYETFRYFHLVLEELCVFYLTPFRTQIRTEYDTTLREFGYCTDSFRNVRTLNKFLKDKYKGYINDKRYVPYKENYVALNQPAKVKFYNASFVDLIQFHNLFILAALPHNSKTADTFWHMIFQYRVKYVFLFAESYDEEEQNRIFNIVGETSKDRTEDRTFYRNDGYFYMTESGIGKMSGTVDGASFVRRTFTMNSIEGYHEVKLYYHKCSSYLDYITAYNFIMRYLFIVIQSSIEQHTPAVFASPSGGSAAGLSAALSLIPHWVHKYKGVNLSQIARWIMHERVGCFETLESYETFVNLSMEYLKLPHPFNRYRP